MNLRMRLYLLTGLFMLAFAILAARAIDLSVLQGEDLHRRAQNQYQRKITAQAHRGQFLDRRGHTLAISLPVRSLSVDLNHVKDRMALADRLAPLIGMEKQYLRHRLKKAKPNSYPILARKLPPSVIHKIENLRHPALFFMPDMQRYYTMGEIMGHILGFLNYDGTGAEGLEKVYEKELQGQAGSRIITQDRMGRIMPIVRNITEAKPGTDVVLTIDATIQYIAYRALMKGVTKHKAKAGSVIVMDPNTGDILAMVNQPAFNPNNILDSHPDNRRNRAIMDAFEPGSTFKIFTIGSALDLGLIKETTIIDIEKGKIRIGDRIIRDLHAENSLISVSQVIQKSSNVGAAKIGMMMKADQLEKYILNFGFTRATGVEQTNEASGSMADITHYRFVGQANRSYGYGLTATPLQIITAVTAAINGGQLRPPHLVAGKMIDNQQIPIPREPPKRVLGEKTSATLRHILTTVVSSEGTAVQAKVAGYTVAGKTGTARKASGKQGYMSGNYFASFVGFIPAESPKLIIFVGIDEPESKQYYGGLAAAPVFREIAEEVLPLLSVLPSTPTALQLPPIRDNNKPVATPAPSEPPAPTGKKPTTPLPPEEPPPPSPLLHLSLAEALQQLKAKGITPLVEGMGRVAREETTKEGELRLILE